MKNQGLRLLYQPTTVDKKPIQKRKNQNDSLLILKRKKIRIGISVMNREDRIRTCDTLVPNQVLYQAELLPELNRKCTLEESNL